MPGLDWARPEWLSGLALVPIAVAVIVWTWRRRRSALDRFADAGVRIRTQALVGDRRGVRAGLLVFGLAALILAIAGPRYGTETVATPPVGQEIVFAVDVSRSMLASDVAPTRLDRARLVVRQTLATLPAAEAGLVVFAGEAALVVPLTRDASAIDLYLSSIGPDWVSDPSTDLSRAVGVALEAFGPESSPGRAVVVLSDGEDHGGGVQTAVREARDREIEVYGVGIGTETGARVPDGAGGLVTFDGEPVVSRLDPERLNALAEDTGGRYVEVGEGEDGLPALIGRLQALDTGREEGRESERRADRYRWPLALALLAIGLETLFALGRPSTTRPSPALAIAATAVVLAMGRSASPEEMYEEGRYHDALTAMRQADREAGAEPRDAFNRGNAAHRAGEYVEAAAAHAVAARMTEDRERAAAGWYNAGNDRFRLAEAAEAADPSDSQRYWDSAVAAYREALLRTPGDMDAKHNLELALRNRDEAGGGGGGGDGNGGGGGAGGGDAGGGTGMQPPSTGGSGSPDQMSQTEAERLLDALAAEEREALSRGEGGERARRTTRPGW